MSGSIMERRVKLLCLVAALLLLGTSAFAGGGSDTTFDTVVSKLTGWAEGGLGRVISLAAVIMGGIISVVRTNPIPILSGIAFAMILSFTPGIVTGLLTGGL